MYEIIEEIPTDEKCPMCGAKLTQIGKPGYFLGILYTLRGECGFECDITGWILLSKCRSENDSSKYFEGGSMLTG